LAVVGCDGQAGIDSADETVVVVDGTNPFHSEGDYFDTAIGIEYAATTTTTRNHQQRHHRMRQTGSCSERAMIGLTPMIFVGRMSLFQNSERAMDDE
jgi:hypothetical protein